MSRSILDELSFSDDPTIADADSGRPSHLETQQLEAPLALRDDERYHLVEKLGAGGMGEVHRTSDLKTGRDIAMKTLLPADDKAHYEIQARRFLREARIQAALEHPAIVPVYDIGVSPQGNPYFTMKRIRGETLHEALLDLKAGRASMRKLNRRKLITAFLTVCYALDYAHTRGVVHRDLKPANIMLGSHGEVYVLDWGIARLATEQRDDIDAVDRLTDLGEITQGTLRGAILGTIGYMPPEQLKAETPEIDTKSDVYALGAMLYEIATLKPFHEGDSVSVVTSTLNPDRRINPLEFTEPELMALCEKATRFNKESRISARQLAEGVERYLDGDRDLAVRRRVADDRASRAEVLAKLALSTTDHSNEEARAGAMREAAGALALDPQNDRAIGVVSGLIANPPDELPHEAQAIYLAREDKSALEAFWNIAVRLGMWFFLAPLVTLMGIRSGELAWFVVAAIAIGGGFAIGNYSRGAASRTSRLLLVTFTSFATSSLSLILSPFVLVPGFAATNTLFFASATKKQDRVLAILLGVATILVPLGFEGLGWISGSFSVTRDGITIHPRALFFNEPWTTTFLIFSSVFSIVTPSILAGHMRDQALLSTRREIMNFWHLRHLLPSIGTASPTR
jgi:eukaryotic-like serine/threonine-protein kinase